MTITLAKYGLSGDVIQSASTSRGSLVRRRASSGLPNSGVGVIASPVSGCFTVAAGVVPSKMITSSPPEIGGEMPVPLRPIAAEERGEAVEVVLAPDLERMMVALRAVEPDAEEELADHRGDLVRLAAVAEQHRRAVA